MEFTHFKAAINVTLVKDVFDFLSGTLGESTWQWKVMDNRRSPL